MNFVKDQVPHGGWYFLQGNIRIEGDTCKELEDNVIAHRMNNGLPDGNPEEEIKKQITERIK